MDRAKRLQKTFNICYELHKNGHIITLDAVFKKLDSGVTKTTISDDMKFMRFLIMPIGKRWVLTEKGIEAAEKRDIFQF